jgi:short chain dehydrogenase
MGKLDGKVAVITGCASGLGKQDALRFAHEGANLAICDVQEAKLAETKRLREERGAEVVALRLTWGVTTNWSASSSRPSTGSARSTSSSTTPTRSPISPRLPRLQCGGSRHRDAHVALRQLAHDEALLSPSERQARRRCLHDQHLLQGRLTSAGATSTASSTSCRLTDAARRLPSSTKMRVIGC